MDNEAPIVLSVKSQPGQVIPTQKYKKEICRVGTYAANGKSREITKENLAHWKDTFGRMKFSGTKIPVPLGSHKHPVDPATNRGWVREMDLSEDGQSLIATIEAIGEDSILELARNDVSIYSPSSYIDGKGTVWPQPITHVCITATPNILGMSEAVVASLDQSEQILPVETLELVMPDMPVETPEVKPEVKTNTVKITTALEPGEYTLVAVEAPEASQAPPAQQAPVAASLEVKADPKLLALSIDNTNLKLSQLVSNGNITPVVSNKLAALVNETYICSGQLDISLVLDILGENKLVDMKQKAAPQTLALEMVSEKQARSIFDCVEILNKENT